METAMNDSLEMDAMEEYEGNCPISYSPEEFIQAIAYYERMNTLGRSQVLDILDHIPNLFRLVDLVEDRGSGGIVERIVIDQKSLSKVINTLQPGSYKSISNIDFKALDNLVIKPIGVYGNQQEILKYLQEVGCLYRGSEPLIFKRNSEGEVTSALRSGLYLTMSRDSKYQGSSKVGYIFYWPEEATWDDRASALSGTIRRNREIFMRYLMKLTEQTVALVSSSQAQAFVWERSPQNHVVLDHEQSADTGQRLKEFQVFESEEKEEAAFASPGFKVSAESVFSMGDSTDPTDASLVPGEERIGLLTQRREQARTDSQQFEESISPTKLREIISRSGEGQPHLKLGNISPDSLQILAANGLREKYSDAFKLYDRDRNALKDRLSLVEKEDKKQVDEVLARDKPMIVDVIRGLINDPNFMPQLSHWEQEYPSLGQLTQPVRDNLCNDLKKLLDKGLTSHLDRIITQARKTRYQAIERALESASKEQMLDIYESLLRSLKQSMEVPETTSNCCTLRVDSVINGRYQSQYSLGNNAWLSWSGTKYMRIPPQIHYSVYPLELTEHDRHQCQINEDHVPKPRVASRPSKFHFALAAASQTIEFIQIVQNKCLLVVCDSEQGHTRIFIEDNVKLSHATQSQGKITLYHEKLGGSKCFFAFDQTTRFLAVVHGENELQLSVFEFDEQFSSLRRHRSPMNLSEWYNEPPEISGACFQTGRPELCLIESSGRVRVLSLVSRMFRMASLKIDNPMVDIFPAPDGSCLLVVVAGDLPTDPDKLLAFHWQSFGTNQQGIDAAVVPKSDTRRVGTRFHGRGRIHIISFTASDMTLASNALQVKQKTAEFAFLSENDGAEEERGTQTLKNSLIDCHLEVWNRFPVVAAVTRDTLISVSRQPRRLILVSPQSLPQAPAYFARMISTLRNTTKKPVGDDLIGTIVSSISTAKFESFDDISEFKLGSFFVELICLVPLHLAITLNNKFMPLKDGAWDPDYESSLVGASIIEVNDSLSLGWYESIFQSYMAKKFVRVVSSMGEQSGKSFCLNHFADTSFTGSVMRTTEGVWLSCTPTKDYLLVSLDFEGSQATELSAQEDMLLVLFNTAVSNLVLFRNNFAISRNIEDLFTSFQSSAKIINPSLNPDLFNSTLAIIIKDVTDADINNIQKEFSLQFSNTVQLERDKNFISRLHRGKVQIIPWPVIDSPEFYSLFTAIRTRLETQSFTHQTGGAFLHKLKSLMVDIKTCNWNASDQSQASSRAHQFKERLTSALAHGKTDEGPLKNMNTDEDIPTLENEPDFFVPEINNHEQGGRREQSGEDGGDAQAKEEEIAEKALMSLIHSSEPPPSSRPHMKESEYIEALQQFLTDSLDHRLGTVEQWIKLNTGHFTLDNPDLRELNKTFTIMSNAMQAAVKLCQTTCSQCKLLCLRAHRHSGSHQCGTDHRCVFDCGVTDEHDEQPPCGLEAGHAGRHMCDVRLHSCGKDCSLIRLNGCTSVCNKPLDHEGECMCSARVHLCGQACELRGANRGRYTCAGICHEPWDEPHTPHLCDDARRGCPIKCVVCEENGVTGYCASTDHLHSADPTAVHLCSLMHKCSKLCEAKGICAIGPVPSEVSGRRPCEVLIPAGQLSHNGPHNHDSREKSFHFCDARCPGCHCFCRLPVDHPQKLHSTNHGLMRGTKWTVELKNHQYGVGDEGSMFCQMVCSKQGRHAHVGFCLDPNNHTRPACEHITTRTQPEPDKPKDRISHAIYWERAGFEDPYCLSEQTEFKKCDVVCPSREHVNDDKPSYCTLPIFHPPQKQTTVPPRGYISSDGHLFNCTDPSTI